MANERGLVFLHIPKTAGTTLQKIIDRQYPRRVIYHVNGPEDVARFHALPEERRRALRVIQGHVAYGIHEHLAVPVDYITMLRHPVDLVASMYYFFLKKQFPKAMPLVEGKTLGEFAEQASRIVRNLQTRFVSGAEGDLDGTSLQTARDHLTTRIAAFGLSERFDESLVLFGRRLGWRSVFYYSLNRNQARPPGRDIPRSTVAIIERNNALDMELYDFATRVFEDRVDQQGPDFRDELQRLRRLNPVGGLVHEVSRRVREDLRRRLRARVSGNQRGRQ